MINVIAQQALTVAPELVWGTVGGFSSVGSWHPGVEGCFIEEGDGVRVGTIRRLVLPGGASLGERLVNFGLFRYAYELLDSPLPVSDYASLLEVVPHEGGCSVRWSAQFEASIPETEARSLIQGIYDAGLLRLAELYGVERPKQS